MNFTIPLNELKDSVKGLAMVISYRSSIPALKAVRIAGDAAGVTITGTNLSEFLSYRLKDAEGTGSFIIDFKELRELVKGNRRSGNVTFQIQADLVKAVNATGKEPVDHVFARLPDKDFPEAPAFDSEPDKITKEALQSITQALPLASRDNSRRTLKGILLEPDAIVASDGKQLVRFKGCTGVKQNMILPNTKVSSTGLLASKDGVISQNKSHCQIVSGQWTYVVKAIAGTYPQYQHVIPKESECSLALGDHNVQYLKSALQQFETTSDHNAILLYVSGTDVRFLAESLKEPHIRIDGQYNGPEDTVLKLNRDQVIKALQLGFNKLSFSPGGVNPVLATGRGDDVFVFMSLYGGVKPEEVIKAVHNDSKAIKEENMSKEDQKNPAEAGMPNRDDPGPFEELFDGIKQLKLQARNTISYANDLQKKAKAAQKQAKLQEREFKSTRDILEKLKNVSGF